MCILNKAPRIRFSILTANSRRQMATAFAAMSVIPLLTLVYMLFEYVRLDETVPTDKLAIIGVNLVLSLGGMFMLGKFVHALLALRQYLEQAGAGTAPEELRRAGADISLIASAAEAMSKELDVERKWLADMSVTIEDMARERAADKLSHNAVVSAVLDADSRATMVLDAEGKIVAANATAARIFGIPANELIGRAHNSASWQLGDRNGRALPDEDLPFSVARDKGGAVRGATFSALRPDGSTVTIRADAAPVFDHSARFQGVVLSLEEVVPTTRTETV